MAAALGERWHGLREALLAPVHQVARLNRFAALDLASFADRQVDEFAGRPALVLEPGEKSKVEAASSGLLDAYVMDPASIFPAVALEVKTGDEVLDMCAAPGGKSLVLAESLIEGGRLVANELSDRRRARLRAVLEDYIPRAWLDEHVKVTGHDGTRWCLHQTEVFDRILLDAPCSGERHLLADDSEMSQWSPARSKNLAVRQYALLASALQVVRRGGRIVYSTCSISPLENDAVVARLLKKREGEAVVKPLSFSIGEATEHGWQILPDRGGYGPIYFCALERA
ncbi:MAG: RsmB/NOP family class I SAM-dependent RNA methyltransferase [Bdellovibrionota bacterium]